MEESNYSIECKFDGNNQYASTSITDNITVKKATTKVVSEEQTSTATSSSKYASDGSIYPEYGPSVDSEGVTREQAEANNMHYREVTIDGEQVGVYVRYDPNDGTYHM